MQKHSDLRDFVNKLIENKRMQGITLAQLVFKLSEASEGNYTKGYAITATEPSNMRKTGNEFHGLVKKLAGWGFDANADYARKVNLQREREGMEMNFEALPSWAEKVNSVVYCHKVKTEQLYASVYPANNFGQFKEWFVEGKLATEGESARIESFIPEKSESSRQGTEKTIQIRRVKLENILAISLKGKRYYIVDNVNEL
jgi:hypothetical protein